MARDRWLGRGALVASIWAGLVAISIAAVENPSHEELRALKREAEAAFDRGDIDGLLKFVDENAVAVWQNGEVTRGHQEIKAYYQRMMVGDQSVVRKLTSEIKVDALSQLYADNTATASGTMLQHFDLRDGPAFDLNSKWTATLVKNDQQWKIVSFHPATNMFDNAVLWMTVRRIAYWTGGIAGVVGLLLGVLIASFRKRKAAV